MADLVTNIFWVAQVLRACALATPRFDGGNGFTNPVSEGLFVYIALVIPLAVVLLRGRLRSATLDGFKDCQEVGRTRWCFRWQSLQDFYSGGHATL